MALATNQGHIWALATSQGHIWALVTSESHIWALATSESHGFCQIGNCCGLESHLRPRAHAGVAPRSLGMAGKLAPALADRVAALRKMAGGAERTRAAGCATERREDAPMRVWERVMRVGDGEGPPLASKLQKKYFRICSKK